MNSDEEYVFNLIAGYRMPMVLFTCLDLDIFETLHEKGQLSAKMLSEMLQTHQENTERLLNAAVFCKLLEKIQEHNEKDLYKNSNITTKYLLKASSPGLRNWALLSYRNGYPIFYNLAEAVRTGKQQVGQSHNVTANELYGKGQGFFSSDERQLLFMGGMDDFSNSRATAITEAFDLSPFQTVCDLGGGTGALGYELVRRYPHMKVIIAELAHIVKIADHFKPKDDKDYTNVKFEAVNIFEDKLPQADLYTMSCILHDWNEEKIHELLARINTALKSGGGLLIAQKVLNEDKIGPEYPVSFDMVMMLGSLGKERSFSDYKHLLEGHGFSDIKLKVMPAISDVILCFKI